ncbi:MAG: transposase [Firmicutes bacterium]|nr:transposase [Bacillota bacterium]
MGRRYDVAFKEQAVRWVREGHRGVASVARELGVPENPLHDWVHALDQHPEQPFVGSGRLRPAEQAARDWERRIRDLEEEHAILKKAVRRVANGRKSHWRSFMHAAPPAGSRRGVKSCLSPGAAMIHGGATRAAQIPQIFAAHHGR